MIDKPSTARRQRRLRDFLRQGKTLYVSKPWLHPSGEPATISVSMWHTENGQIRMSVEKYLDKHVMCEQLYVEDRIIDFPSFESAIDYLAETLSIDFSSMTA